jgi:hypothetical protein
MEAYITAPEAARRLGISVDNITKLVDQQILRPKKQAGETYLFAAQDIDRIVSNKDPTLSEEAAQMGIQIQQEVVHSVSALQRLRRRVLVAGVLSLACIVLSVSVVVVLFKLYPEKTSDFFGYYYQFNAGSKASIFAATTDPAALASSVADSGVDTSTSVAASLTKPIAAMSLLLIKATDGQQYEQIVKTPVAGVAAAGPTGSPGQAGLNGINGLNGLTGQASPAGTDGATGDVGATGISGTAGVDGATGVDGAAGAAGVDGTDGVNGVDGTNGTNGADGLSVADVTTTVGDLLIRNNSNQADRLGIGGNGQILTVVGGLPAWTNASGLTAESDTLNSVTGRGAVTSNLITLAGGLSVSAGPVSLPTGAIVINALTAGDYSGKLTSGTYGIDILGNAATASVAASFSGALSGDVGGLQGTTTVTKINGNTLGLTTPTAGNLLIGSGSAWAAQSLSGDATLNGSGVLSLQGVGTAGTYGSASTIPVLTTDSKGRIVSVTSTPITGLTVANLVSADVSQFVNDAGYITASTPDALSNKAISGLDNTLTNIGNTSLINPSVTVNAAGINAGGGLVNLGDTITITGTEADTLASVTGRGATTAIGLTLSSIANDITAGTLRLNGDVVSDLTGPGLTVSSGILNVSGLTNSNLSGSAGITNANLQNSSVTVNTSGPLNGGGSVSLGGSGLTLTCATCLVSGDSLLTVASTTGSDSVILQGETLTLAAGSNITTINDGSGTVTFATSSTPDFTTVNGLTITASGSNTLSIAAGKTFDVNNSVSFTGTDGTSFALPSSSDTLVGRSSSDTLLNKVITAAGNTISGLTNTNLSGAAGISNANLANSGLTLSGNSGSGSVALGGGLTITGSGITNVTASGSTLTVTTTEADTLASVTGRGATTSATVVFNGGVTLSGSVTFSGITSCRTLATNASGVLQCGDTTGDAAAFTDSAPAALADNTTTELFNDATKPNITPAATSQTILVSVHARFTGGGNNDTDAAVRIVRNIGSAASCSSGTQVGDTFSAFMTASGAIEDASGTFLDSPATTSQVFYTVCSSSNSNLGSSPTSNRIDVTLVRIGR